MAHINLLPWRETLRKEQQQEFLIALGIVVAMGAVISGVIHFYNAKLISNEDIRIQYVEEQIKIIDREIKEIEELQKRRAELISRIRSIEKLQSNRPLIVHFFDELVASLPDGVSIETMEQTNNNLKMTGIAQSNARVSSFMRNLEKSEWLANPQLKLIESRENYSSFSLVFNQVVPSAKTESDDSEEAL